jgi:hypothetical protein
MNEQQQPEPERRWVHLEIHPNGTIETQCMGISVDHAKYAMAQSLARILAPKPEEQPEPGIVLATQIPPALLRRRNGVA